MITFACPACLKSYSVPDHQGGMRAKCGQCRTSLVVPAAPATAPWKAEADTASAGTAERAKVPTDADLVLPPVPEPALEPRSGEQVLVVRLQFAGDPGPSTAATDELYDEARRFLADVLYAYRHRLAPNGARLKRVIVDGIERDI